MSVGLYMDVHVPAAITEALAASGVEVLTVQRDGRERLADSALLDRATDLGRVVFSRDEDFLIIGAEWQRVRRRFSGIIYAHQLRASVGQCVRDLQFLASAGEPADFENQVYHVPL